MLAITIVPPSARALYRVWFCALLAIFYMWGFHPAHAYECIESYARGSTTLNGFGLAWDPLSDSDELLLRGLECGSSTTTVQVGSGGSAAYEYVYDTAYEWTGSDWRAVSLTGSSSPVAGEWYESAAQGTLSPASSTVYFVGLVCRFDTTDGEWKCGCADETCEDTYWQLQGVRTAGPAPAVLEEPPAMTLSPVTFENVCPEDAGWPTRPQMEGRDVKVVLPTDRVCASRGSLGGTLSNPSRNVWVVGGEIEYYSTATSGSAGLTFNYFSGTIFVEGIKIDMQNSCNDGIRSYFATGTSPRVVIQNSYIRGLGYCSPVGTHGDMYHAQGGLPVVIELLMQNVRGDLITQGIFVPYRDEGHGVLRMVLDHVELRLDERYPSTASAQIATMIYAGPYLMDVTDKYPPNGQRYNEVYLNWWDPHYPASTGRKDIAIPAVESYDTAGCAEFSAATTTLAQIEGSWCKGSPFGGTFVPLNRVGREYDRAYFLHE